MIIQTVVAVVVIFTILVAFHEFGHYLLARACGMRVDEFAIGFGPVLFKLGKRGDTIFNVRAIPFGGFVRIAGQEPGQEDITDGFQAQVAWKRALVVFAGPFFSALLAVIVFVLVGVVFGIPTNKMTNRVGLVLPQSEAARIGLRTGDKILSVNKQTFADGRDIIKYVHNSPGKKIDIKVDRQGKTLELSGTPKYSITWAGVDWSFDKGDYATVKKVRKSVKQDIREKDILVELNGITVKSGTDMLAALENNGNQTLNATVRRGEQKHSLALQPDIIWVDFYGARWIFPEGYVTGDVFDRSIAKGLEPSDELVELNGTKVKSAQRMLELLSSSAGNVDLVVDRNRRSIRISAPAESDVKKGYYTSIGLLGFITEPLLQKEGFFQSVGDGFRGSYYSAVFMVKTLTSPKVKEDIGGPVMITKMTNSAVKQGPYWVLSTLAALSISLAIINLLPIPILDGGVLVVIIVEALRKRRLSIQEQNAVTMLGLMIIGTLIVTVLYMDIFKLIKGLVPQ